MAGKICDAQKVEVTPSRALSDETVSIRATGLQPNQLVTIEASLVDGAGVKWSSRSDFRATPRGIVDVSHQAPSKGSYSGISSIGPIWSMKPRKANKHVERYISPPELAPQVIEFRLLAEGKEISSAQLEQLAIADGVKRIQVKGNLHGLLLVPGSKERHPGVLVVGGSEGGLPLQKAAWVASHGFAAFALAYFRYEDLPQNLSAIPLEYFGKALDWMGQQPEILPDRIAIVGTSRGGELALQLASMYSSIHAAVAYVPANVRYPACCGNPRFPFAWTWKGLPLSYYPPSRGVQEPVPAMESAIAVEYIHGPVLLVSADDDEIWPSALMARAIVNRLKSSHFDYGCENLEYRHAGHAAGRPEIIPEWHSRITQPLTGWQLMPGGSVKGDAESSLDAIPKVLEFLKRSLASSASGQKPASPQN